ncbi:MAG: hypothetical protein VZS12_11585 [Ruminococcus bromii]|nr:hypothetical protein [Ruminococcus bromii]
MITRTQLKKFRETSVATCNVSELKDIRGVKISNLQPLQDRAKSFIEQVNNPYVFVVGNTVVKVEYEGGRDFSEAFANLLCAS